jgi:hypothetical protein
MIKNIIFTFIYSLLLTSFVTAQTTVKWNDSLVNINGKKICETILLVKDSKPTFLTEYHYWFDKTAKSHIVHVVKSDITGVKKLVYSIHKYFIPAESIIIKDLEIIVETNKAYAGGGYLTLILNCKEENEDIIYYEKSSSYTDFESKQNINEFSFEANLKSKIELEKLLQQIKKNK